MTRLNNLPTSQFSLAQTLALTRLSLFLTGEVHRMLLVAQEDGLRLPALVLPEHDIAGALERLRVGPIELDDSWRRKR